MSWAACAAVIDDTVTPETYMITQHENMDMQKLQRHLQKHIRRKQKIVFNPHTVRGIRGPQKVV